MQKYDFFMKIKNFFLFAECKKKVYFCRRKRAQVVELVDTLL